MSQNNQNHDPEVWAVAKKRASFKNHLLIYILVNIFLWGIWFFGDQQDAGSMPWPIWGTFGWGVGLAFHYSSAYFDKKDSVQREYDKIINKNKI